MPPVYPNYPGMPVPNPNIGRAGGYRRDLVTMADNPMDSMVQYRANRFQQDGGAGNYQKFMGAVQGQMALDPFRFQPQTMQSYQQFMQDPNLGGGYKAQQDAAYQQMNDPRMMQMMRNQAMGNSPVMNQMQGLATGRYSVVGNQANAQRQAAMRDIAMQSSMQQGAQYNPALARTALMQQAGMGQQMAPQVAAAMAQERQAAQLAYMQAIQAAQQGYGQAAGQNFGAANQMFTGAQNTWGAINDVGLQGHAQATSAFNQSPGLAGRTK